MAWAAALDLGRIAFATERPEALLPLAEYLQGHGAEAAFLGTSQLGGLDALEPDIVIVGDDTRDTWMNAPNDGLATIFEDYKVAGIGEGGATLFFFLGLEIVPGMHGPVSRVEIHRQELLRGPFAIGSGSGVVDVYQRGAVEVMGAYDFGVPARAGFEGIANWQIRPHHWPISRQGNFLYWGFLTSTDRMTEEGMLLFTNLLVNHKRRAPVPLARARKNIEYVRPGLIEENLNRQFCDDRFEFKMGRAGCVRATLSWTPASRPLAATLGNAGRLHRLVRQDGTSPLTIEYEATDEELEKSPDWRIMITTFQNLGVTVIDYQLQLSFPE